MQNITIFSIPLEISAFYQRYLACAPFRADPPPNKIISNQIYKCPQILFTSRAPSLRVD
jgi:hypothetical protein